MNSLDKYGPQAPRQGFHIGTKVLLIVIVVAMAFSAALNIIGGQDSMFVYTWLQLGMPFISLVLLLALLVPGARRFVKGNWPKKIATGITCVIVVFAGLLVYSFLYTYALVAPNPHSYHTSPDGKNRVVVMTFIDPETLDQEEQKTSIIAFPMKNRFFFYDTDAEPLYDDNRAYPSYAVEWTSNEDARVYLQEFSGEGKDELLINMNDRRTMVEEPVDGAPTAPDADLAEEPEAGATDAPQEENDTPDSGEAAGAGA